jgi:hypothetical protein
MHCRWHAVAGWLELGTLSHSQSSRIGSAAGGVHVYRVRHIGVRGRLADYDTRVLIKLRYNGNGERVS